jgi:hypothetical protein
MLQRLIKTSTKFKTMKKMEMRNLKSIWIPNKVTPLKINLPSQRMHRTTTLAVLMARSLLISNNLYQSF